MAQLVKVLSGLGLALGAYGTSIPTSTSTGQGTQYTIPSSVTNGQNLIANVDDPQALNAQIVCPGYSAYDVQNTDSGFTASLKLAGTPCNVYGTDVESLKFSVSYQAEDRLNIEIIPSDIQPSQSTWYILPESLVPKPQDEEGMCPEKSELAVTWSNEPSFNFQVIRKDTGDVLFDTKGTKLIYENQFIEFITALPEDYNLYGLGDRIQGFRLPNNATLTTYAADIGDPLDR
jgi:alpha-glucosidase